MSRNEWESGTVVLPTAALTKIKKTVRDQCATFHIDVRGEVGRIHRDVGQGTRSVKTYQQRLDAARSTSNRFGASTHTSAYRQTVRATAEAVIEAMLWSTSDKTATVHKPTVAEVAKYAPSVTSKTSTFAVTSADGYPAASISFEGRTVRWSVSENNHAVDHARDSVLATIFFAALDKVTWTRDTGGSIVGNDEYNREADYVGGGGNYITATYGPRGEAARATEMGVTVSRYRTLTKTTLRRPGRTW